MSKKNITIICYIKYKHDCLPEKNFCIQILLNILNAKFTACGDRTRDQRIKSPTLYLTELTRQLLKNFKTLHAMQFGSNMKNHCNACCVQCLSD